MKKLVLAWLLVFSACSTPQPKGSQPSSYTGHGAESVDPKVIQQFAPPSLPPAVATLVQNILEVQAPGMGQVSPDGKSLYFSWAITGTSQLWKVNGPLQFPTQMTSGNDPTGIDDVTPNGRLLILNRDRSGEENPGIYLQRAEGGPLVEVQHKKGARTHYQWVSGDSDTIYYTSNDITPESYALYAYKISTGKKELLFSEPGIWSVADVHNDEEFLLSKATGARTREIFSWKLRDRKLTPVIGQGEKEEYEAQFAKRPGEFLVLTSKLGEFRRLYLLKGGKLQPITPEVKRELDDFAIDVPRTRIYLTWSDQGRTRFEVISADTFKPIPVPQFKGAENVYARPPSRSGRYVSVGVDTAVAPRTSYIFDWSSGKLTQWVKPSLPETDASHFSAARLEEYPARDGTKIPMWVTRPAKCAADPCPVVVHFHGGPEAQSTAGFNRYAAIFASAGMVFVEPNVRGSEGYGKAWRFADDGPKRLSVITDIEDCATHIKTAWAKNGKAPRIGVIGWSYGGYSALMAMSRFAGSYDAGVALVGMSNLRSFLLNTAPYRRTLRVSEYGDPEKDKAALEELSPTSYLDRIKAPLMIIQGVNDPRVPVGEALQMKSLLERKGIKAPLILFGDEGHGSKNRQNKVLEVGHALKFFQETL